MITVGLYGIPDTTHSFGIPSSTHDHGITIMKNGCIITSVQLERYSGMKHDNSLPLCITQILKKFVPPDEDIRFISVNSFLGDSVISPDGDFRIVPQGRLNVRDIIQPASCHFFSDGEKRGSISGFVMCHEFAHIASVLPFIGTFPPNSLLLHIDGGASESSSSVWFYDGREIQWLHHGWNDLKTVVNNFNVNPLVMAILNQSLDYHLSVPGKLMGYSSYGTPREKIRLWLKDNNWFLDFKGDKQELLNIVNKQMKTSLPDFDTRDPVCMDIAATIQKEFENCVLDYIRYWAERTGADHLCYGGGAALNIITNTRLEKEKLFKKILIPPCMSDCGLSLGAAAWMEFRDCGYVNISSPYLNKFDLPSLPETRHFDLNKIARFLYNGGILGLFQGYGEIGPRALGHRSILARPDNPSIKKRVSETIKQREWYRPVAPVILEDIAQKIFLEDVSESILPKYMLGAYSVKDEYIQQFSGVIHADRTVRAQIVGASDPENRLLIDLLRLMYDQYGIMGLINTSLNEKGGAIAHFPSDALCISHKIGLDGVIINESFHRFH